MKKILSISTLFFILISYYSQQGSTWGGVPSRHCNHRGVNVVIAKATYDLGSSGARLSQYALSDLSFELVQNLVQFRIRFVQPLFHFIHSSVKLLQR